MNKIFFTLGLLIVIVQSSLAFAEPAEVIIIRHAEKPPTGKELSLRGRERANALGPYFMGMPEVLEYKSPVAIYAQAPKTESSSVRSIETVRPLSDALHLKINTSFVRDDYKRMVDEIKHNKDYDGKLVLICWEHKVIPEIAKEFNAVGAPSAWPDEVFDRTWVIKFSAGHNPTCDVLPQRLMYGDSAK